MKLKERTGFEHYDTIIIPGRPHDANRISLINLSDIQFEDYLRKMTKYKANKKMVEEGEEEVITRYDISPEDLHKIIELREMRRQNKMRADNLKREQVNHEMVKTNLELEKVKLQLEIQKLEASKRLDKE